MKKVALGACLMAAGVLLADTTPVMVSLVTPVQAPYRSYDVTGLLKKGENEIVIWTGSGWYKVFHPAYSFLHVGMGFRHTEIRI